MLSCLSTETLQQAEHLEGRVGIHNLVEVNQFTHEVLGLPTHGPFRTGVVSFHLALTSEGMDQFLESHRVSKVTLHYICLNFFFLSSLTP